MVKQAIQFVVIMVFLSGYLHPANAQDTCEALQEAIWSVVAETCGQPTPNQVCYAQAPISAELRSSDSSLNQVGDTALLDDVQTLTLGSAIDTSGYGVALLHLELPPNAFSSDVITLLAFGDVWIQNEVQTPSSPLFVTLTANGRVRRSPDTRSNDNIITTVSSGTFEAVGRDASGTWVYIASADVSGWLSTQVLTVNGDVMTLAILPDTPVFAQPMTVISLTTGIEESDCYPNGILVQTPDDVGRIALVINGVTVEMASTLYLTSVNDELAVYVLEGMASVTAMEASTFAPAGTIVTVPLEDLSPIGEPIPAQPYDSTQVQALPVGALETTSSILPQAVSIAPPLPVEEIEVAVTDYFANLELMSGVYTIRRVAANLRNSGVGFCPPDVTMTFRHDGGTALFGQYPRLPDGSYGADDSALNAARNPDPNYLGSANRITLTSTTSLSWFAVSNGDGDSGYCEFIYEGIRTGN